MTELPAYPFQWYAKKLEYNGENYRIIRTDDRPRFASGWAPPACRSYNGADPKPLPYTTTRLFSADGEVTCADFAQKEHLEPVLIKLFNDHVGGPPGILVRLFLWLVPSALVEIGPEDTDVFLPDFSSKFNTIGWNANNSEDAPVQASLEINWDLVPNPNYKAPKCLADLRRPRSALRYLDDA